MEIDHIYICVNDSETPVEELLKLGLTEGSPNNHPGQGTSNRRFFFYNSMLEFLYASNIDELINENTKPLKLYEQCVHKLPSTSPFGLIFRPENETDKKCPFPSWNYHPEYLPPNLSMQVGLNTPLNEPNYIFLAFAKKRNVEEKKEPIVHKLGLKEITQYKVFLKDINELSEIGEIVNKIDISCKT